MTQFLTQECRTDYGTVHLCVGRPWPGLSPEFKKAVIRCLLERVRVSSNFDEINASQVLLQHGIIDCEEDEQERRECGIGLLFLQFVRSNNRYVSDTLVDALYGFMGDVEVSNG
jgi:hypothetical protein